MLYCAAATAALASASPAFAQAPAAPLAPTGFRVEALVGYDRAGTDGFHISGVLFGAGAGYDFAVSNGVSLGIDAEASDSTGSKYGISTGRDLYAGGRINVAVSPRSNVYLKGGYTNARVKVEDCCADNGDGFRIGVGGQYLVSGKTYVGAEYRYSNYESDFDRHQVALTLGTRF
jgi:outer membrane immunogenic protein